MGVAAVHVIPVLDLKGGVAVHARRGQRDRYRPVESALAPGTADPLALAQAYRAAGFTDVYVADLDAIAGTGDHLATVAHLARVTGLRVWLDAGVQKAQDAGRLLAAGVAVVVAGSETLASVGELAALVGLAGAARVAFSLDLRGGAVLAADPVLRSLGPVGALQAAVATGVTRAICLDLDAVGSEGGPPLALLRRLLQAEPGVALYAGGGVRDAADLDALAAAGAAGALVATALHSGRLTQVRVAKRAGQS